MWTFLGLFAAFIVIKFIISASRENDKISFQGGIYKKYSTLIDLILKSDSRASVIENKYNKVIVGVNNIAGSETYTFFESYDTLHVMCRITNNPLFENMTINWDFPETMNQEDMLIKIIQDKAIKLKMC